MNLIVPFVYLCWIRKTPALPVTSNELNFQRFFVLKSYVRYNITINFNYYTSNYSYLYDLDITHDFNIEN